MDPEQAAAWLTEACTRVCVLAYGLPRYSDSTSGGIGAGTRRVLWYGPSAMPGNVGPMQLWEDLLARAGAPALPLPPDWERPPTRAEGDDVGDLTATTPPGPPSPGPVGPLAPPRSLEELRRIGMVQAAALMQWAANPTASGGAQAAVVQIVNTFGAIVDGVSRRLEGLAASVARQASTSAVSITTELQRWLGIWAIGSYQLWAQARDVLATFAQGAGQGLGLGVVLLAALALYMFTGSTKS